jgi:hypothetical protein
MKVNRMVNGVTQQCCESGSGSGSGRLEQDPDPGLNK